MSSSTVSRARRTRYTTQTGVRSSSSNCWMTMAKLRLTLTLFVGEGKKGEEGREDGR
jgi:hypothetical protein